MNLQKNQLLIISFLFLILIVAILLVFFIRKAAEETPEPDFTRHFISGTTTPATFKSLDGEVVAPTIDGARFTVVTSWASWSPYTATEFAVLAGLREQFDDSMLNIVLLNRKESVTMAKRYLDQYPAPEGINMIIDTEDTFYSQIEGYTMPETVVYNQAGEVVLHLRGPISHEKIATLLAE